jgi:hypothetical protein
MMEWMSRILVAEMAGADENFGTGYGRMWLIFVQASGTNTTCMIQELGVAGKCG